MELERLPREVRPDPRLLKYYALSSLLAGPFFVFPMLFMYLRYRTLRYHIDEDGIRMAWGVLFRREVSLNYERIQDIHLSSNVVERWLGLGKIQVQTASASSKAEMTIEGLTGLREMRDFLYERMRGVRASGDERGAVEAGGPSGSSSSGSHSIAAARPEEADELGRTLREVAAEVRALREALQRKAGPGG